jgi:hypothetical protein
MRKYIIGALFGFVLTFSLSVHADDIKSLVGKAVQGTFPVTIKGKALEKQAIVIDGIGYIPVRTMGDALGLDVTFNADLGISLNKKLSVTESTYDVTKVTQEINRQKRIIWAVDGAITTSSSSNGDTDIKRFTIYEQWKVTSLRAKEELAMWEARKAALAQ